jgi:hypothetical protein
MAAPFFSLPAELRNRIYEYVFCTQGNIELDLSSTINNTIITTAGAEILVPFNLALLGVNRQIHQEALPVFYGGVSFILDGHPAQALGFFQRLPQAARFSVSTITFPRNALESNECYIQNLQSTDETESAQAKDMNTIFGFLLATCIPSLRCVSIYIPYGGSEDFYCRSAPIDAMRLLRLGRIHTLNYFLTGKEIAGDLEGKVLDDDCLKRTLGKLHPRKYMKHEFRLVNPPPRTDKVKAYGAWLEEREKYRDCWSDIFDCKWGDTNIDGGCGGEIQAVITFTLRHPQSRV